MKMQDAALDLFMAECAAMTIKENEELGGGLSSALQTRHKIRDSDLHKIFKSADQREPRSFTKIYLLFQLMLYSGAAYKGFENLVSSVEGALSIAEVTPHWDSKSYSLGAIYWCEPMNLFPGWSIPNLRNNQFMLDPHVVIEHLNDNGRISTDLHGMHLSGSKASTNNITIAQQLNPHDAKVFEDRANNQDFPGTKRRNSVYSNSLDINKAMLERRLENISAQNEREYKRNKALKIFKVLMTELETTTEAGDRHYDELLTSVSKNRTAVITALTNAKCQWNTHRRKMIKYIKTCCTEIETRADLRTATYNLPRRS